MTLSHDEHDWLTDGKPYLFRTEVDGLAFLASKQPGQPLRINFAGLFGKAYDFQCPQASLAEDKLLVSLQWTRQEVMLRLNGQVVEVRSRR